MSISFTFDYNNAMAEVIGAHHGLTESILRELEPQARKADAGIRRLRQRGKIGFYDLANVERRQRELGDLAELGGQIAGRFANFVVLGIGGSALGPTCVQNALGHTYHNLLKARARKGRPRIFVVDNIDPDWLGDVLDVADPAETCYNVITKSGRTPETISQFMALYDRVVARVGKRQARQHFLITTTKGRQTLRRTAERLRMRCVWIPENVGGRFSELTAVGLVAAAVAGFDIDAMVRGAQTMAQACEKPDLFENPAYLNAAIHYLADTCRGKSISVMMPYCQALRDIAAWYGQLWAESLGKRRGRPPHDVGVGQTPVSALGTTDQHSQLQLYKEGPNDKIVTFLGVEQFGRGFPVGTALCDQMPELAYLGGRDIAELFLAEMEATEFSLANAERPSVRITLGQVDEAHIGALLFFFMVQTAFAGGLYGINAFNQPGVEESKQATAAIMGRGLTRDRRMMRQLEQYREERNNHPAIRLID